MVFRQPGWQVQGGQEVGEALQVQTHAPGLEGCQRNTNHALVEGARYEGVGEAMLQKPDTHHKVGLDSRGKWSVSTQIDAAGETKS